MEKEEATCHSLNLPFKFNVSNDKRKSCNGQNDFTYIYLPLLNALPFYLFLLTPPCVFFTFSIPTLFSFQLFLSFKIYTFFYYPLTHLHVSDLPQFLASFKNGFFVACGSAYLNFFLFLGNWVV